MAKPLLNPRQAEILAAIKESIATNGYPPTYRELSQTLGISYPGSLAYSLNALARKGFIINNPMSHARGLRVVGFEPEAMAVESESLPKLDPGQRSLLLWLHEYSSSHGYPPTIREIRKEFSIPSNDRAIAHLREMQRQGYLARTSFKARAIRILALPEEVRA